MLEIEGLSAWYGEARVLGDVSLSVSAGEVVTLVGRNGAGKTTLLRSVMGLHRQTEGVLRFAGAEINRTSPDSRAKAGLGWVPDDRGIYASLRLGEPAPPPGGAPGRVVARPDLPGLSCPGRSPKLYGHPALRRRAADARHCARPADGFATAAAG